ncbi:hypothetical protein CYMTET_5142 [Cymbomonas tetramitiformis]|uniref:Uncharacterized protein n=1 Tax=Cymbomonas tetramitiformis TaxID=36881 RepID=A0AAE0LJ70_9CHLO|nr:hypothetical protein CYMTET_5142 [Cymbomonas tetramitiformis]
MDFLVSGRRHRSDNNEDEHSDEEGTLEDIQASADVVANNFVLDRLVSHNHHNSSQAYFDAILNILRVHYIDDSVSEDTRIAAVPSTYAHTWNGVLHKWKGMFKGYSEVDVCLECSEFFQDDYAHLEKCPNCPNEARYEEGKTVNRAMEKEEVQKRGDVTQLSRTQVKVASQLERGLELVMTVPHEVKRLANELDWKKIAHVWDPWRSQFVIRLTDTTP